VATPGEEDLELATKSVLQEGHHVQEETIEDLDRTIAMLEAQTLPVRCLPLCLCLCVCFPLCAVIDLIVV